MEKDYRSTLNLPRTDFPMKAKLPEREPQFLSFWQEINLYKEILKKNKSSGAFILHDGPPYANGDIHLGHALNKILKDIIVRFKSIEGYFTPFIPGWDCHGLPVEHQLFKELGIRKQDIDILEFRKKAKDYALKFVGIQREEFRRLAILGDWENPYLTLSPKYEAEVLYALAELVEKGYVYRGIRPVNWCINCETALAEAEVEYEDHVSDSIYVKFPIKDLDNIKDASFLIWTTTPWTLISNVAIALNPDAEYIAVDTNFGVLIFADKLKEKIKKLANLEYKKVVARFKGKQLEEKFAFHPFYNRESKVVSANFVSLEEGSGCVHIAPGHGEEDWLLGKEKNLPLIMPLDDKGFFTKEANNFEGVYVWDANKKIISILSKNNNLIHHGTITHSYPHCWRCKKPIVFRATSQWFLSIDKNGLRQKLLREIENVNWIPEVGKSRIKAMVEQRPDWCLSRQRYWGVPIPSIKCSNCNSSILNKEIVINLAKEVEINGSEIWFKEKVEKFIPQGFSCPICGNKDNFKKEVDIIDVWFESGVSHKAVLNENYGLKFPSDLYLEGSDQHRGWFQSSLIPAVAIKKEAPYRQVLTHGFVVDGEGRKMSKSLGNVISPQQVIEHYGADILRLWVISRDYSEDLRISDEILKQVSLDYRKIRNTAKFILANLYDFDPDNGLKIDELDELDYWALNESKKTIKEIMGFYQDYKFYKAFKNFHYLCNETLSAIYLDILKDRLYTFHPDSKLRRSSQTALYEILKDMAVILAPILPFTAEDIWKHLNKGKKDRRESIHLLSLKDINLDIDYEICEKWEKLLEIRNFVMKALEEKRTQNIIGSSLEAKIILKIPLDKLYQFIDNYKPMLNTIFIVSQVNIEKINEVHSPYFETKRGEKLNIEVEKADGKKCARCWIYSNSVGSDFEFSDLCSKCVNVLKELKINEKEEIN
jgi:isoleucyl-tRNA synthetase